jgi:hypothetical protein
MKWVWPDGEVLFLSYMEKESDYNIYHGHNYAWVGWEELTRWPTDTMYKRMMSCNRSPDKRIPLKYRATSNPAGPGHNWVKQRFGLPGDESAILGEVIREPHKPARVAIRSRLSENIALMEADPYYVEKIAEAASSTAERAAWVEGSWDIVAGGLFQDLWTPEVHVVDTLPITEIPAAWYIDRSYDHGQSKPFSVGWWAESNGDPIEYDGKVYGRVRGDLFRIREWYGWTGEPNKGVRMMPGDIAQGIVDREEDWGLVGRVRPGPADSAIFDDYEPGKSVAGEMAKRGVRWVPSGKGKHSRSHGWQRLRTLMHGSIKLINGYREQPGLFVCRNCNHFLRTVPSLPLSEVDMDDVDTEAEDHVADEVRYRAISKERSVAKSWSW